MGRTITLYRSIGPVELDLVEKSGFKRWPPRQEGQPTFYPVTNGQYAIEIATSWFNEGREVGFVTRFDVKKSFMDQFEIHTVGEPHHTEWWIPAERLEELNDNIVGLIEVIGEYRKVDI